MNFNIWSMSLQKLQASALPGYMFMHIFSFLCFPNAAVAISQQTRNLSSNEERKENAKVQAPKHFNYLEEKQGNKCFSGEEAIGFLYLAIGWMANLPVCQKKQVK